MTRMQKYIDYLYSYQADISRLRDRMIELDYVLPLSDDDFDRKVTLKCMAVRRAFTELIKVIEGEVK